MHLFLASGSPRRMDLLREAGFDPQRIDQQAPEHRVPGEPAQPMALRLAREKATWAADRWPAGSPEGVILGADTIVVLDDLVLGKPSDPADARTTLARLAGRSHRVCTGVHLIRTSDRRTAGGVEQTVVHFGAVSAVAIESYVSSGLTQDKAGAYGIQDLSGRWEVRIQGLRSNVIGLPIERVVGWLSSLGVEPTSPAR